MDFTQRAAIAAMSALLTARSGCADGVAQEAALIAQELARNLPTVPPSVTNSVKPRPVIEYAVSLKKLPELYDQIQRGFSKHFGAENGAFNAQQVLKELSLKPDSWDGTDLTLSPSLTRAYKINLLSECIKLRKEINSEIAKTLSKIIPANLGQEGQTDQLIDLVLKSSGELRSLEVLAGANGKQFARAFIHHFAQGLHGLGGATE